MIPKVTQYPGMQVLLWITCLLTACATLSSTPEDVSYIVRETVSPAWQYAGGALSARHWRPSFCTAIAGCTALQDWQCWDTAPLCLAANTVCTRAAAAPGQGLLRGCEQAHIAGRVTLPDV